jgi:hypothetical protein
MKNALWLQKFIFVFIPIFFLPYALAAQVSQSSRSSKEAKAKDGVAAIVISDGAIVYLAPDQDSTVIMMLPEGQKVRVSKNATTSGPDGGDKFHKIRVKTKEGSRLGYISAIDIQVGEASPGKSAISKQSAKRKKASARKKFDGEEKHREEMYFSRFVGVLIGSSEYKESINNVNSNTNFLIYGLKVTGPDLLLGGGMVMDINVALHYGAPSYYEQLSAVKPTGFVLFLDADLIVPIVHNDNSMIYLGLGPLLVLSKYSVLNADRMMDLSSANLGASFEFGGALRFSKVAVRLEAKYYIEKQFYKQFQIVIQNGF